MRTIYICDTCDLEITSTEFHQKGDVICPECGGLIKGVESSLLPGQEEPAPPPNNVEQPSFMVKCEGCDKPFSKRASKCPKCGLELRKACQVCKNEIPANSTSCPKCGDPVPFHEEGTGDKSSSGADNYVEHEPTFWDSRTLNEHIVCPHCNKRGCVLTRSVTEKKGISGAKATGALLTGGLSVLLTGLSRKESRTEATCRHCNSSWQF